uniref:Uncharacterized protein n=1 Tax=Brassica campestris TaxID=3711 RepID=M4DET9_BRACM
MGIMVLFLDEKVNSVIHGFIHAGRAKNYMLSLKAGSIVKVDRFEVARLLDNLQVTANTNLELSVGKIRYVQGFDLTKETTRVVIHLLIDPKDGASIIGKRSVNNLSQIYEDLAVIINLNNLAMSLLDSREYGRKELSSGILGVYLISEIIIRRWDGGGFSGELKVSRSLQDTWKTLSHQRVRGFACLYTC